ncbi:DMT family transporter [Oceanicaulis alexandrii]|uniref:DMT family transporter n=1 Tax=Oceanicaulis alexandrii TaxID=153233 RepID=UPI002355B59D|nr:DMT family transporter [Oceanicaulis alexandrii]
MSERPASSDSQTSQKALTITQLIAGMAMFGSATPVSKIVTQAAPVFIASLFRVGLGAVFLAPLAWRRRETVRDIATGDWMRIGFIALFGMVGFSAFMLYGMRLASGVTGAVVMSTTPAVTAAASMVFLGDRSTWRKLVAIGCAVSGVLILQLGGSGAETGGSLWGVVLVFAAVCCESAYTLLGKTLTKNMDPVLVAFLASALSIPLFVPLAVWQWPSFTPSDFDVGVWTALVWYGVGTLALGSWLWYAGVQKAEGATAAAFMGVMPVSALVLSYILLGEAFAWVHLAGFAVVFSGVMLMSWEHASMSNDSETPEED